MKKILAFAVALILVLSVCSASVLAVDTQGAYSTNNLFDMIYVGVLDDSQVGGGVLESSYDFDYVLLSDPDIVLNPYIAFFAIWLQRLGYNLDTHSIYLNDFYDSLLTSSTSSDVNDLLDAMGIVFGYLANSSNYVRDGSLSSFTSSKFTIAFTTQGASALYSLKALYDDFYENQVALPGYVAPSVDVFPVRGVADYNSFLNSSYGFTLYAVRNSQSYIYVDNDIVFNTKSEDMQDEADDLITWWQNFVESIDIFQLTSWIPATIAVYITTTFLSFLALIVTLVVLKALHG